VGKKRVNVKVCVCALFSLLSALCSLLSALCSLLSALCSLLSALCCRLISSVTTPSLWNVVASMDQRPVASMDQRPVASMDQRPVASMDQRPVKRRVGEKKRVNQNVEVCCSLLFSFCCRL
jgi:hypothetical protein